MSYRLRKLVTALLFAALLVVLIGCGGGGGGGAGTDGTGTPPPADAGAQSQKPDSEPTDQGQEQEPVTLRSSIQSPPAAHLSKGLDWMLDEIERRTDGKVTFERYYSEALAPAADQLDALTNKIADIALFVPSYAPGQVPLATVGTNPALWRDSWVGSKALRQLYKDLDVVNQEAEARNVKIVGQLATPSYYVISREDVSSFEDLKGLRVIATGQIAVLLQSLGAQTVTMPITEGYEAMERKTVDGGIYGLTAAATYGVETVAQSVWELPVGGVAVLIGMNMDAWNALTPETQQIIEEIADEHADAFHQIYQVEGDEESLQKFVDAGVKINTPQPADIDHLRESAVKIWDEWVDDQESNGRPGRETLDAFVGYVNQFEQEYPY